MSSTGRIQSPTFQPVQAAVRGGIGAAAGGLLAGGIARLITGSNAEAAKAFGLGAAFGATAGIGTAIHAHSAQSDGIDLGYRSSRALQGAMVGAAILGTIAVSFLPGKSAGSMTAASVSLEYGMYGAIGGAATLGLISS